MFGAPDLPRRPAFSYRHPPQRRPGVGDHVCLCGGYVGLIVEDLLGGSVMLARRHAPGWRGVIESPMLADRLQVAPATPIGVDEMRDPAWRRGVLG